MDTIDDIVDLRVGREYVLCLNKYYPLQLIRIVDVSPSNNVVRFDTINYLTPIHMECTWVLFHNWKFKKLCEEDVKKYILDLL